MAKFTPKKIVLDEINYGNQFRDGDGITTEAINAPIEASAFAQAIATNPPDYTKAHLVGNPKVSIGSSGDGTPRLVFENLKGDTGEIPAEWGDAIKLNSKKISNLEAIISNDAFISDSSVAYQKSVPVSVAPYASIDKIGGMTYKDGNALKHAKVKAIESKGANEFTDSARIFSNYQYISAYMVFTFDGLIPNSPYTISLVNGYKGNAESRTEKYVNLSNKSFEPINPGALGWLVHPSETYCSDLQTVTSSADGKLYLRLYGYNNQTQLSELFSICTNIMLNSGESALSYTPYGTLDTFTIPEVIKSLDGYGMGVPNCYNYIEYTDNGVKYVKYPFHTIELKGTEDWKKYESKDKVWFYLTDLPNGITDNEGNYLGLCTHCDYKYFYSGTGAYVTENGELRIWINSFITSEEWLRDWKEKLAEEYAKGTPVTIIYPIGKAEVFDITDLMPTDNYIKVEGGGTIIADNEYEYDVPTTITYQKRG